MNILVAGIHAVGKSYLCREFSSLYNWCHRSASQLIKEEIGGANWSVNKQVVDPNANQRALVQAVRKKNASAERLLLDGHFVLRGADDQLILLAPEVFSELNLSGVILIEAPAAVIVDRLKLRDGVSRTVSSIELFLQSERSQAEKVCAEIKLPLVVLNEPTFNDFSTSMSKFS
jgi:adenylate kinase